MKFKVYDDTVVRNSKDQVNQVDTEIWEKEGEVYTVGPYYFKLSVIGREAGVSKYIAVDHYDQVVGEVDRGLGQRPPERYEIEADREASRDPELLVEALVGKLEEEVLEP